MKDTTESSSFSTEKGSEKGSGGMVSSLAKSKKPVEVSPGKNFGDVGYYLTISLRGSIPLGSINQKEL